MHQKLGLEGVPVNVDIVGVSNVRTKTNRLVSVDLRSLYNEYRTTLNCLVVPKITNPLPSRPVNISKWNIPQGLCLADPYFHTPSEVDLLIGISHVFSLLKSGHFIIDEGLPEIRETELGWVVTGEIRDESAAIVNVQQVNAVTVNSPSKMIERFWENEEVVEESSQNVEEQECEETFHRTHQRDPTGRYVVDLPFRENVNLDDNRSLRHFLFLERRLHLDPELLLQYSKFIEVYESLGHCKEIHEHLDSPGVPKLYLPHHAVLRPTSSSTKLRVVFDASAKSPPVVKSLNDVLQVDIPLQDDVLSGADTIDEAVECQRQLQAMLSRAGFPIHKWCIVTEAILQVIPESERETLVHLDQLSANQVIKTLGLVWSPATDEFMFVVEPTSDDEKPITEKGLFPSLAKFDPTGHLFPVVVISKSQLHFALPQVNEVRIPSSFLRLQCPHRQTPDSSIALFQVQNYSTHFRRNVHLVVPG